MKEHYEPTEEDIAGAEAMMSDEQEKLTAMREKMIEDIEQSGKTGYLTKKIQSPDSSMPNYINEEIEETEDEVITLSGYINNRHVKVTKSIRYRELDENSAEEVTRYKMELDGQDVPDEDVIQKFIDKYSEIALDGNEQGRLIRQHNEKTREESKQYYKNQMTKQVEELL
ncbi:MAG: hypothetical protein CO016_00730 [Candidatus Yonathbacteria bacterium CG_4_8_14_3_um_filter_46_25]|nr:MAG: hypothetical protein CO016_00730 [Candidatus Yonathbacteria bacterium CG_4_8_14_3_um_filter_46_25]